MSEYVCTYVYICIHTCVCVYRYIYIYINFFVTVFTEVLFPATLCLIFTFVWIIHSSPLKFHSAISVKVTTHTAKLILKHFHYSPQQRNSGLFHGKVAIRIRSARCRPKTLASINNAASKNKPNSARHGLPTTGILIANLRQWQWNVSFILSTLFPLQTAEFVTNKRAPRTESTFTLTDWLDPVS